MAAWKKVLCGECQGTGKVFPHKGGVETCPGCSGKGEILRSIEDIEREEAMNAAEKSTDNRLHPTPSWCKVAECNYAREPFEYCQNCQYCNPRMFAKRQKPQEAKADAGKPRLSLVPTQIIYDIARVREYGDKKYGSTDNWKTVEKQRYVDAMFRHLLAFVADPDGRDVESGLPHLWHLECNAAFLSEMMKGRWQ